MPVGPACRNFGCGWGRFGAGASDAIAIGLIVVMLQAYLPPALRVFRDAFAFAFVILVLVARPSGLIRAKGMIERV